VLFCWTIHREVKGGVPVENLNKLSTAEKAIAVGGILMLIASFFNWWSVSIAGESAGRSGWGEPGAIWSVLAILVCIALAAFILATKFGNLNMPDLPENVTWGKVFGGAAVAVVVLMLLKAWRISAADAGGFDIGFFLGLIAAAAVVYGGYTIYSEEKTSVTA
jgi:uncharacterized membrane protein